jgi:Mrp family chromosome partitioning ATPase
VGILPDANLLAAMVDTVILVVAAGQTPFRLVHKAVETIGRDRIFGVVLNKVSNRDLWGDYSSYSYYGYGPGHDKP